MEPRHAPAAPDHAETRRAETMMASGSWVLIVMLGSGSSYGGIDTTVIQNLSEQRCYALKNQMIRTAQQTRTDNDKRRQVIRINSTCEDWMQ